MRELFQMMREFNKKYKIDVPEFGTYEWLPDERHAFRAEFAMEEIKEYVDAIAEKDFIKVIDSLADQMYVLLGTITEHGIGPTVFMEAMKEVHMSNMSKTWNDGKLLKGENYLEPDFERILDTVYEDEE